jgi:hypothetical protein
MERETWHAYFVEVTAPGHGPGVWMRVGTVSGRHSEPASSLRHRAIAKLRQEGDRRDYSRRNLRLVEFGA